MMQNVEDSMKWSGLLPKTETQAQSFIEKNPQFDGRGIIVGVLDTGVDPGAIGLQTTSDGKPKVIDIIDCTGSGDVLMGEPVKVAEDDTITANNGRRLKINPLWKNPSGTFRVGIKALFELYPKNLKDRVIKERNDIWLKSQRKAEQDLLHAMAAASPEELEDLNTRLNMLKTLEKDVSAVSPLMDCVLFHDGHEWFSVVDCSGLGDLSTLVPMREYRMAQEYRRLTKEDALNFGVNVYDNGKILSIVVDSGAHGTHVAGIISAHHPEDRACNGIAPGAQIVSLKIGDSRLGSMETGVGLVRALIEAVRKGCHIINMSFGEGSTVGDTGVFARLADQLVHRYGIVYCSSAGNNGPGISTVGAPGGSVSSIISVAALVTDSLMGPAYSMAPGRVNPPSNYTWSSVGPFPDGAVGVSIIAPGGAITCVSNWTLNKKQLMNGTSMSSPNACGNIALLLSAAKQTKLPCPSLLDNGNLPVRSERVSSQRVRLAVENSSKILPNVDILGQNHGLVQTERAWEHLLTNKADPLIDIPLSVSVLSPRFSKGIYLKQPAEVNKISTHRVFVEPVFHEDSEVDLKICYEMKTSLLASVDWVKCPDFVHLLKGGKVFNVTVDPRVLDEGVHVGFIRGFDDANREKGPVFEVCVTVVRPFIVPNGTTKKELKPLELKPNERFRKFLVPPPGCTLVEAIITDKRDSEKSETADTDTSSRLIVMHALQIFNQIPYRDNEKESYLQLTPGSTHTVSWKVTPGATMELVIARYWSTLGAESGDCVPCSVVLSFSGVLANPSEVFIKSGQKISSLIQIYSPLSTVDINPTGKFDKIQTTIFPSNNPLGTSDVVPGKIQALGERDFLPDGTPLYQLVLEYSAEVSENSNVTPRWPMLNGVLYESPLHAQFHMVYQQQFNKFRLIHCGDAWPKSFEMKKGSKYVIRLQVRASLATKLETFLGMPMILEKSLKNPIKLNFFRSQVEALGEPKIAGGASGTSFGLFQDTFQHLCVAEPTADQIPKGSISGDVLIGSINYLKQTEGEKASSTVRYVVSISENKGTNALTSSKKEEKKENLEEKKEDQMFLEAIRDAKTKYLDSLVGSLKPGYEGNRSLFDEHWVKLRTEYPTHLPLFISNLNHRLKLVNSSKPTDDRRLLLLDVCYTVDQIVDLIDFVEVAVELGQLVNKEDEKSKEKRKDAELKKSYLVKALSAKCHALLELSILKRENDETTGLEGSTGEEGAPVALASLEEVEAEFKVTYESLQRWENTATSLDNWRIYVYHLKGLNKFGAALQKVGEIISAQTDGGKKVSVPLGYFDIHQLLQTEQQELLTILNWTHLADRVAMDAHRAQAMFQPF